MTSAGRSDAAYGNQTKEGRRRLGYVISLVLSSIRGPCRLLQLAPKFIGELVNRGLGGDAYALSEMREHVALLREFYAPFVDLSLRMEGLADYRLGTVGSSLGLVASPPASAE